MYHSPNNYSSRHTKISLRCNDELSPVLHQKSKMSEQICLKKYLAYGPEASILPSKGWPP